MPAVLLQRLEPVALVLAAAALGAGATLLAYAAGPVAPLAVAGAAALLTLSISRPLIVLYAAVALVPLELFSARVGEAGLSPAEAAFALSGVGWAGSRLVRGEAPFTSTPLGPPLLLLVLAIVPGIAIVDEPFDVAKVFVIWSTFLLVYEMIATEGTVQTVRNVLFLLGLSAAVVGVIAIIQSGGKPPELVGFGETATGRAQGSFGHPNTLATFEAVALPGALVLGLRGPPAWRPVALGAFGIIFAGLALSLSRGGLLAVAGALAMMLAWAPFRRTVVAAVLVLLVVGATGGNPLGEVQQVELLTQRIESIEYSAGGVDPRFRVWEGTPEIILDHPIIGVGENNFSETASRYGLTLDNVTRTYEHAHNIPLTIAAELGLIALAVLLWLTVVLIRTLVRAYHDSPEANRGLVLAIAGAFLALALQGLVDYTLRSAVIVAVTFTLLACAVVLARTAAPRDTAVPSTGP
jgi:putative inorganic carbon (hco3(-)) transporter